MWPLDCSYCISRQRYRAGSLTKIAQEHDVAEVKLLLDGILHDKADLSTR